VSTKFRAGDIVDLVNPGLLRKSPYGRVSHFGGRNGLDIIVQFGPNWYDTCKFREHELKLARHLRLVKA
jgi:hypothetical protein